MEFSLYFLGSIWLFLKSDSTSSVFEFYLGEIFDVDFEKEPFIESGWMPGKVAFPAMEVTVERKVLGDGLVIG